MKKATAISKINTNGILLVFPVNNRPEPKSLWSEIHPKLKMKWEWDDNGDRRVADMWLLMKKLSDSREVVYSKWYQGRATFFSRSLFAAMFSLMNKHLGERGLSRPATEIYEALQSDSPLSTKELKKITGFQGKENESTYQRALKELFSRLLIVGFGEVDDGAFPSLAVGTSQNLFEDLVREATAMETEKAQATINLYMPHGSKFRLAYEKVMVREAHSHV